MNGVNIGSFDLNAPPDTQSAGLGDDHLRSVKSTFQQVLNDEHVFDSAGGVAGAHRFGSARAYVGTQSQVSSSGTEGRLMVTSDSSRIFHVGSGGTMFLGGATAILHGSFAGNAPQRHYWVEEMGVGITGSSGTTLVTFPNSGFSGVPYTVIASLHTEDTNAAPIMSVRTTGESGCVVRAVVSGSLFSGAEFFWRSIGSRAL